MALNRPRSQVFATSGIQAGMSGTGLSRSLPVCLWGGRVEAMDTTETKSFEPVDPRRWRWGLISLCWLAWGLFYASRLSFEVPELQGFQALVYALPDTLLWIVFTPIPIWLARRLPLKRGRWLLHGSLHLIAAITLSLGHSLVDTLINVALDDRIEFGPLFAHLVNYGLHGNILLYFLIIGIHHYFVRVENLREERRRAAELRAQLSEARLEALRLQLRPHFLFNVLNTISGLMVEDPRTAQRVVRQLGDLLRMSLNDRGAREISLRRELELTRAYLEIEQVRFQDRLTTQVTAPDAVLDFAVPPFILQPIVENAVHHGMRPEGATRIDVTAASTDHHLELRVTDDGPGMASSNGQGGSRGNGIGLTNTRTRLAELYGDQQEFRLESGPDGGVTATLILPRRLPGEPPAVES